MATNENWFMKSLECTLFRDFAHISNQPFSGQELLLSLVQRWCHVKADTSLKAVKGNFLNSFAEETRRAETATPVGGGGRREREFFIEEGNLIKTEHLFQGHCAAEVGEIQCIRARQQRIPTNVMNCGTLTA